MTAFPFRKKNRKLLYFGPALIDYPVELRNLACDPFVLDLLKRADPLIEKQLGWSALARLENEKLPGTAVHEDYIVNECLYQMCLFEKWNTSQPGYQLVAGFSLGEVAAMRAAGFCSFNEALLVCCAVVEALREPGEADLMMAFGTVCEIGHFVSRHRLNCYCAIDNGSRSVWSGLNSDLDLLQKALDAGNIKGQRLSLHCASHSPLINTSIIEHHMRSFYPKKIDMPYFSSVTGGRFDGVIDSKYWAAMITQPSRANEMHAALAKESLDQIIRFGSAQTELRTALSGKKHKVPIHHAAELLNP